MDHAAYSEYVRRAETAESVRDLHLIVQEVWRLHASDPQAEAVDRACWARAERLIAAQAGRPRPAPPQPSPPSAPVRTLPDEGAFTDWKERAAGAEAARRNSAIRIVK